MMTLAEAIERAIILDVQADPSRVIPGSVAGVVQRQRGHRTTRLRLSWQERNGGAVTTAGAWTTIERTGRVIDRAWRQHDARN